MAIVGFSFSKIDAEKKLQSVSGSIDINHNISIEVVEKTSLNVGTNKNDVLKIVFNFNVSYGSNLGHVGLLGEVIYADAPEIISETLKGWESDKKLNKLVNEQVLSFVYTKAIVKALDVTDTLGLPAPIPMPRVNFGNNENTK